MHVLALHALLSVRHHTIHPGIFKIFGWTTPTLLGQVLHQIARWIKIIAVVISFGLLYVRGFTATNAWKLIQMLFLVAIGLIIIPSISPDIQKWVGTITKGATVGATGASWWVLITVLVVFGLTIFSTIIRNPAESGEV